MKRKRIKFLLLVYLLTQISFYSFAPLYALFATDLQITARSISLIWGGYSLLTATLILVMGKLENRERKGRLLTYGYVLYAIASAGLLIVDSAQTLMIVFAINSIAAGITFPAYKTLFAKNERRGNESEQWAWLDASNMFAAAIGAGIGGILIGSFGFNGLFYFMLIANTLAAIVAYKHLYRIA